MFICPSECLVLHNKFEEDSCYEVHVVARVPELGSNLLC